MSSPDQAGLMGSSGNVPETHQANEGIPRTESSGAISPTSADKRTTPKRRKASMVGGAFSSVVQAAVGDSSEEKTDPHGVRKALRNYAVFTYHSTVVRYAKRSLCLLRDTSPLRRLAVWIVTWPIFEALVLAVIILNTAFLGLADYSALDANGEFRTDISVRNKILVMSEPFFATFFVVEAALKIVAMGFVTAPGSYLRNGWHVLDFIVVVVAIVSIAQPGGSGTVVRVVRVLRPLRAATALPSMRGIVRALVRALPSLGNVVLLVLFLQGIGAIVGLQLYSGTLHGRCRLTSAPVRFSNGDTLGLCVNADDPACFTAIANITAVSVISSSARQPTDLAHPLLYSAIQMAAGAIVDFAPSGMSPMDDPGSNGMHFFASSLLNATILRRCLPSYAGYSSNRGVESSLHTYSANGPPSDCWWPVDPSDLSACSLTPGLGRYVCPPARWCGSNFDGLGMPRFASSIVTWSPLFNPERDWGFSVFDSAVSSYRTVFQVSTLEGWYPIFARTADANDPVFAALLFMALVLSVGYFAMSLTLAVLWESFRKSSSAQKALDQQNDELLAVFREAALRAEIARLEKLASLAHERLVSSAGGILEGIRAAGEGIAGGLRTGVFELADGVRSTVADVRRDLHGGAKSVASVLGQALAFPNSQAHIGSTTRVSTANTDAGREKRLSNDGNDAVPLAEADAVPGSSDKPRTGSMRSSLNGQNGSADRLPSIVSVPMADIVAVDILHSATDATQRVPPLAITTSAPAPAHTGNRSASQRLLSMAGSLRNFIVGTEEEGIGIVSGNTVLHHLSSKRGTTFMQRGAGVEPLDVPVSARKRLTGRNRNAEEDSFAVEGSTYMEPVEVDSKESANARMAELVVKLSVIQQKCLIMGIDVGDTGALALRIRNAALSTFGVQAMQMDEMTGDVIPALASSGKEMVVPASPAAVDDVTPVSSPSDGAISSSEGAQENEGGASSADNLQRLVIGAPSASEKVVHRSRMPVLQSSRLMEAMSSITSLDGNSLSNPLSLFEKLTFKVKAWWALPHHQGSIGATAHALVTHPAMEWLTFSVILANVIILSLDGWPPNLARDVAIAESNAILTLFFTLEMMFKLSALGLREYIRDSFNVLDAAVVIASWAETAVTGGGPWVYFIGVSGESSYTRSSAVRSASILRVFRLARKWTAFDVLLKTAIRTFRDAGSFGLLLSMFVYTFALIGQTLFAHRLCFDPESGYPLNSPGGEGGTAIGIAVPSTPLPMDCPSNGEIPRRNFDTLLSSAVTVFSVFTLEGWNVVQDDAWRAYGWSSAFFFLAVIVIGQYLLLDLFEAVLLSNFDNMSELKSAELKAPIAELSKRGMGKLQASLVELGRRMATRWKKRRKSIRVASTVAESTGIVDDGIAPHSIAIGRSKNGEPLAGKPGYGPSSAVHHPVVRLAQVLDQDGLPGPGKPVGAAGALMDEPMGQELRTPDNQNTDNADDKRDEPVPHMLQTAHLSRGSTMNFNDRSFYISTKPRVKTTIEPKYLTTDSIGSIYDYGSHASSDTSVLGLRDFAGLFRNSINTQSPGRPRASSESAAAYHSTPAGGGIVVSSSSTSGTSSVAARRRWGLLGRLGQFIHVRPRSAGPVSRIHPELPTVALPVMHKSVPAAEGINVTAEERTMHKPECSALEKQQQESSAPSLPGTTISDESPVTPSSAAVASPSSGWAKARNLIQVRGNNSRVTPQPVKRKRKPKPLPKSPVDGAGKSSSSPLQFPPLYGVSLGFLGPNNSFRLAAARLLRWKWFDRTMLVYIMVSCLLLALDNPMGDPESIFSQQIRAFDALTTVVFTLEMCLRIVVNGFLFNGKKSYLRSWWNFTDAGIVSVSIASLFLNNTKVRSLRALRALRALRPLRMLRNLPGLRLIVNAMLFSSFQILNVLLIFAVFLFVVALLAVSNFKGAMYSCSGMGWNALPEFGRALITDPVTVNQLTMDHLSLLALLNASYPVPVTGDVPTSKEVCISLLGSASALPALVSSTISHTVSAVSVTDIGILRGASDDFDVGFGPWRPLVPGHTFDTTPDAVATLFSMTTTEGWLDVMHATMDTRGPDIQPVQDSHVEWSAFWAAFMLLGAFFMARLFIAVVLDNYNEMKAKLGGSFFLTDEQKEWVKTQKALARIRPLAVSRRVEIIWPLPRRIAWYLSMHPWAERMYTACIVANSALLAAPFLGATSSYNNAVQSSNVAFNVVFSFELLARMFALQSRFWGDRWNLFDLAIVLASNIGLILEESAKWGTNGAMGSSIALAARAMRLGRAFRLVGRSFGLTRMFNTFLAVLPSLANTAALIALVLYAYSVVGVELFKDVAWRSPLPGAYRGGLSRVSNFQSFPNAFMTLFRAFTGEGWNTIMADLAAVRTGCVEMDDLEFGDKRKYCGYTAYTDYGANGGFPCVPIPGCGAPVLSNMYFFSFSLMVSLIFLNLLVAVVIEGFTEAEANAGARLSESHFQALADIWVKFDPHATLYIDCNDLTFLLQGLDEPLGFGAKHIVTPFQLRKRVGGLKLPIYGASKVHFHDVAQALARRVYGDDSRRARQVGFRVPECEETRLLKHAMRNDRVPTLDPEGTPYKVQAAWAARLIEGAWRRAKKRKARSRMKKRRAF